MIAPQDHSIAEDRMPWSKPTIQPIPLYMEVTLYSLTRK
jgi:coenzyme PQQ precursor peptide PqqA